MKEENQDNGGKRNGALIAFALAAAMAAFLVYLPTLWNGFVNLDDPGYVYENPNIRSFGLSFIRYAFTTIVLSNWHPLTMVSYGLDYMVWGLDPFGYHLVNIIFHAANTFLVAYLAGTLARSLGQRGSVFAGVATALLFGLHPLHVESVAWVAERKDVLSVFFFLLSLLAYLRFAGSRSVRFYLLSLAAFALALLSKPMAITLPLVLLIIDFHPLGRLFNRDGKSLAVFIEKVPFFILSAASAFMTLWAQKSAIVTMEFIPFQIRLFTAVRAYIFYLYKMILPLDLAVYYPHPLRIDFLSLDYLGAITVFVAITAFCILMARKERLFLSVWLFYVITLAPVIGIIQVSNQAAADRYTYLPALGPFILVGVGAGALLKKREGLFAALAAATAAVSIALSVLTVRQVSVWKDPVSLWSNEIDYLKGDPGFSEVKTVYLNGEVYQYVPRIISSYYYRGMGYDKTGDFGKAIADYTRVIELNPDFPGAYNNRGTSYAKLGRYPEAIEDFKKAVELNPYFRDAYLNLGNVYMKTGEGALAAIYYEKARALGLRDAGR